MKNKTIAILESRSGEQLAEIVRKYGGKPFLAPALAEVPDIDPAHIADLINGWDANLPDVFIFQTGVGVKALFATTDHLNLTSRLSRILELSTVVARGPKPIAALRSRRVRIDLQAGAPYTTKEIIVALDAVKVKGRKIVVQRYGNTNLELQQALADKGAEIEEIATYRWSMPDEQPLIELMDALDRNAVDMVCFTSASQAENLFALALSLGRTRQLHESINRSLIASIGPVCSNTLRKLGVRVDVEANPPKLGPFISAINNRFIAG
ncbi:uroporphyrinogen-III synthase [Methylophilaceae bacterium]|nr:uroporphyrinogen-III synthase [Methylophilaceae bacterium]